MLILASATFAQSEFADTTESAKGRNKNLLLRIIDKFNDFDTRYIEANKYSFTSMFQNTNTYDRYKLSSTDDNGATQTIELSPTPSFKIGPYFGWKALFIGYTFDVGNIANATEKTEFNLNLYTSLLGLDIVYKRNTGKFNITEISGFGNATTADVENEDFRGMDVKIFGLNFYYIFNHRKFSYPAAFNQSTRQLRSAGTWNAGFKYSYQTINFDYTKLPDAMLYEADGTEVLHNDLKFRTIRYYDYSLNFGYSYNWVFARNCLFAISLSPALGYKHLKGETMKAKDFFKFDNINIDFVTRIGLVWNNSRYFVGSSTILHMYDYKKDKLSMTNTLNWVNVYAGLYFDLPRKKRPQAR